MYIYEETFPKTSYETLEYILNEWKAVIHRANGNCEICHKKMKEVIVVDKIPSTDKNIKKCNFYALNSRYNKKVVCSDECKLTVEIKKDRAISDFLLVLDMILEKRKIPHVSC